MHGDTVLFVPLYMNGCQRSNQYIITKLVPNDNLGGSMGCSHAPRASNLRVNFHSIRKLSGLAL